MLNVIGRLDFWWIRLFLKLFKPEHIIKRNYKSDFELGEKIIASNENRDLYYIGDDFYFIPKIKNK